RVEIDWEAELVDRWRRHLWGVDRAEDRWLRSFFECGGDDHLRRTHWCSEAAARFVERDVRDSWRRAEVDVRLAGHGREHVARPDRRGRFASGEASRRVVVEADPCQRERLRREA